MNQAAQVSLGLMVPLARQVRRAPMVHVVRTVNQEKRVHKVNAVIPALWVDGRSPNTGKEIFYFLIYLKLSQTHNIPNCPKNAIKLWDGYSLSGHHIGGILVPTDLGITIFLVVSNLLKVRPVRV